MYVRPLSVKRPEISTFRTPLSEFKPNVDFERHLAIDNKQEYYLQFGKITNDNLNYTILYYTKPAYTCSLYHPAPILAVRFLHNMETSP